MHQYIEATRPDGERVLTVILPDGPLVVSGDNPQYEDIFSAVRDGEDAQEIRSLADLSQVVAGRFESLSERVSVAGGNVYFDGDPVHNALAKHIVRALEDEADFMPLVNFYEKLAANPSEHSREQLYEWLDRRDFTIAPDGDFYAYKGCARGENGQPVSINRGKAVVDGEAVDGAVPNPVGAVVEFPRSEVEFDPSRGCARGLHVGDYTYASGWARGVLLLVKVNPRDVVSVPTDSNAAKVRVSRYEVQSVYDRPEPIQQAVYDDEPEWEDDEEDEYGCGAPDCEVCYA